MTVKTIGGDIQHTVIEPADMHLAGKGDVLHFREWLDPIDPAPVLGPEPFRVGDRFGIHPLVFCSIDPGGFGDFVRHGKECGVAHRALRVSPRISRTFLALASCAVLAGTIMDEPWCATQPGLAADCAGLRARKGANRSQSSPRGGTIAAAHARARACWL